MKKVLIKVQEETLQSNNKYNYRKIIYNTIKQIPEGINKEDYKQYIFSKEMIRPEIQYHGSYYCELTEDDKYYELDKHDYNITILDIQEINNKEFNNSDKILYEENKIY